MKHPGAFGGGMIFDMTRRPLFVIQYEEYKQQLHGLKPELENLKAALGLEAGAREIEELEEKSAQPEFWNNMDSSQKLLQRVKQLKDKQNA